MKSSENKFPKKIKFLFFFAAGIAAGIIFQKTIFDFSEKNNSVITDHLIHENVSKNHIWTCSMHPEINLPKAGKCPICFMDLIPLEQNISDEKNIISVSPYAAKLMEIETYPVQRRFIDAEIRMVGKVDYDETGISYISAWMSGRLERLYINYTGIPVNKGDHMADIYSPDLITGQAELIQSIRSAEKFQKTSDFMMKTAISTIEAARSKLRLMGMTQKQIKNIEKTGKSNEFLTLNAPAQGIIIHKNAKQGMYVEKGTRIFTIADLSKVWIKMDAYESDLQWLKYGSNVDFTTEAFPGKHFKGTISFIDPFIDSITRTAKVRVNVDNPSLKLKPGMFIKALVRVKVNSEGNVINNKLKGKWISPMHPEIIKDSPGTCDVCGMPLVTAESLGYVNESKYSAPLVIPVTSVLRTGKRAIVYLALKNEQKPTFESRQIILGPRLGHYYLIEKGLKEGDRVVTKGAFKIDAEMQIQAKPGMMSLENSKIPIVASNISKNKINTLPEKFILQLENFIDFYFKIHKQLTKDSPVKVNFLSKEALKTLQEIEINLLTEKTLTQWMNQFKDLTKAMQKLSKSKNLEIQREIFSILSVNLEKTLRLFPIRNTKVFKASCPMAFKNKGASWLQKTRDISNPYFGESMINCGKIEDEILAGDGEKINDL